eukprot:1611754-Prymnesium_polylepis.1
MCVIHGKIAATCQHGSERVQQQRRRRTTLTVAVEHHEERVFPRRAVRVVRAAAVLVDLGVRLALTVAGLDAVA